MKKLNFLLILSMFCFSFAGFSADMKGDIFAHISSAEEVLELLPQDPNAILIRTLLGEIEVRRGADASPGEQAYKKINAGFANIDFPAIPEGMSFEDYMEECSNTKVLSWLTHAGSTYDFRINVKTKIVKFTTSESFERRDLKDGSVLLLFGRDTKVKQTTISFAQKIPDNDLSIEDANIDLDIEPALVVHSKSKEPPPKAFVPSPYEDQNLASRHPEGGLEAPPTNVNKRRGEGLPYRVQQ